MHDFLKAFGPSSQRLLLSGNETTGVVTLKLEREESGEYFHMEKDERNVVTILDPFGRAVPTDTEFYQSTAKALADAAQTHQIVLWKGMVTDIVEKSPTPAATKARPKRTSSHDTPLAKKANY